MIEESEGYQVFIEQSRDYERTAARGLRFYLFEFKWLPDGLCLCVCRAKHHLHDVSKDNGQAMMSGMTQEPVSIVAVAGW